LKVSRYRWVGWAGLGISALIGALEAGAGISAEMPSPAQPTQRCLLTLKHLLQALEPLLGVSCHDSLDFDLVDDLPQH